MAGRATMLWRMSSRVDWRLCGLARAIAGGSTEARSELSAAGGRGGGVAEDDSDDDDGEEGTTVERLAR
jgi:hypothetical protein